MLTYFDNKRKNETEVELEIECDQFQSQTYLRDISLSGEKGTFKSVEHYILTINALNAIKAGNQAHCLACLDKLKIPCDEKIYFTTKREPENPYSNQKMRRTNIAWTILTFARSCRADTIFINTLKARYPAQYGSVGDVQHRLR